MVGKGRRGAVDDRCLRKESIDMKNKGVVCVSSKWFFVLFSNEVNHKYIQINWLSHVYSLRYMCVFRFEKIS